MKKTDLSKKYPKAFRIGISAAIALGITLVIMAVNIITAHTVGHPILAREFMGGEVTEWVGAGVNCEEFYPLMDASNPVEYTHNTMHFDFISFMASWLSLFLLIVLMLWVIGRIKRLKAQHKAEKECAVSEGDIICAPSAEENNTGNPVC